jgi:acyl carrier protein
MTRTDILARLTTAFQTVTQNDLSQFDEQSELRSLGIDSLDFVEAIVTLEQEMRIRIEDKELNALKTVGDLLDLVERKRAAAG